MHHVSKSLTFNHGVGYTSLTFEPMFFKSSVFVMLQMQDLLLTVSACPICDWSTWKNPLVKQRWKAGTHFSCRCPCARMWMHGSCKHTKLVDCRTHPSIWPHDVILTINSQPYSCNDLYVFLQPSSYRLVRVLKEHISITFINITSSNVLSRSSSSHLSLEEIKDQVFWLFCSVKTRVSTADNHD